MAERTKAQRRRRALALMTALFVLLVLLLTAGHAAHHLHEDVPCAGCPVCGHLSAVNRSLFGALLVCALIALSCHMGRRGARRYGQTIWPCLSFATPVSDKVKLTI